MRVLLISPVPRLDPQNGDVAYTQMLLKQPPAGVEYETYEEALASGRLRELARRRDIFKAVGAERARAFVRTGREHTINELRKRGLLFEEPFRFFSVEAGAYDLVHCHVFSAAFDDLDVPLVMGGSATIEDVYRDVRRWPEPRIRFASVADATLARLLDVQHTSHRMPAASAVVCHSDVFRQELIRRKAAPPDRLHVAPPFVETGPRLPGRDHPKRIGFIATDFAAKGGPEVLRAFAYVRERRPDAELLIVGSPPTMSSEQRRSARVEWHERVPRHELLEQHMPTIDVFAYPTHFDGLPFTVLEIMSRGIPVVTSDYFALPEMVGYGAAGVVVPRWDTETLADALVKLLDPQENANMRQRSAAWFDSHYSAQVALPALERTYAAARLR